MAPFLMARDSNTHPDGVDQIVADQARGDCDRKLGPGRRQKPMLFIGRAAVHGVPPAIDKTSCDCQHHEQGEPAARSVEESFGMAFPTGYHQTEQAKNASNGHTSQGKSQSRPEVEGEQEGEAKKQNGGETGHPHIHGGDPTPALPTSRSGAVAQSKREQNHAGKSEENKKQQREKDYRHPLMLARVRAGLALLRDQSSEVSAPETTRLQLASVWLNRFHGCGRRRSSQNCGVSAVALADRCSGERVGPLFCFSIRILPEPLAMILGIICLLVGPSLALPALFTMRAAGTHANPAKPALLIVRSGPYRFTRNPMYLALCLVQAGIGFLLNDWITLLFVVPLALVLHFGVILPEERYLEAKFGEQYLALKREVRRWIYEPARE